MAGTNDINTKTARECNKKVREIENNLKRLKIEHLTAQHHHVPQPPTPTPHPHPTPPHPQHPVYPHKDSVRGETEEQQSWMEC